jgi:glycosyltransferase involved in cell wall biosynthesis
MTDFGLAGNTLVNEMYQRPELVDRYYESDIFAFAPIWDEGFGLPAVEAMAAGLPVVSSHSGAPVETAVGILVERTIPRSWLTRCYGC